MAGPPPNDHRLVQGRGRMMDDAIVYRRLRAPQPHGATLLDPPWDQWPQWAAANRRQRESADIPCQGRSLRELARQAHRDLWEAARRYTRAYRDLPADPPFDPSRPIFLSGHQPELFHPGVWFKNIALARAAEAFGGWGINLLIDNDNLRSPGIRVPDLRGRLPQAAFLPFDDPTGEIPFEDRGIANRETFCRFGERVCRVLAPLVDEPLIRSLWPRACAASRRTDNLGRVLAQARHEVEGRLGLVTFELPLSRVCQSEAFRWFVAHVLAHLTRFREVYNDGLHEYRRVHRLRSRNHPASELTVHDGWMETPFWVWHADAPYRRPLLVLRKRGELACTDGKGFRGSLALSEDGGGQRAVEQLAEWEGQGVRIRPRALMTTMFARLLLGDLFLHGIGGSKYDQLTDALIRRFWHCDPPRFVTLTATLKLPVQRPNVSADHLREIDRRLRDLRFNPQRFVALTDETRPLVEEKRRWIERDVPADQRRRRHEAIARVNEALQPFVEDQRRRLLEKRRQTLEQLRTFQLLDSREYSFCLFPESIIRERLLDF